MSEAVSAAPGAEFRGLVTVRDTGPRGMITLRGDLGSTALKKAVKTGTGAEVPGQGEVRLKGETGVAWMSPDELLILCRYGDSRDTLDTLEAALRGQHFLAANVSDARAVFELNGTRAREVLAKLTPANLAPGAFGPGQVRRTRLAQAAAAFWMRDAETFEVICFRSVAAYAFDLLSAAAESGSEVGLFGE